MSENSLQENLSAINDLLKNGGSDDAIESRFRKVYLLHQYEIDGNRKIPTIECGSTRLDSANALYRLLFLTRPKQVDCSDMYASDFLFALVSPDGEFVADFAFHKYGLAVYFSATSAHLKGHRTVVSSGVPGADNGIKPNSPLLKLWCSTLKKCLHRKWLMYAGNDFSV